MTAASPTGDLGADRTLASIQRADLFGPQCQAVTDQLIQTVKHILEIP
jgi:hypothetical protein